MTALPHQLVWQARQIAEAHSLLVVPVTDVKRDRKTGDRKEVKAWVIYRRGERICKTSNPRKLVDRVRTVAGITEDDKPAGGDARR